MMIQVLKSYLKNSSQLLLNLAQNLGMPTMELIGKLSGTSPLISQSSLPKQLFTELHPLSRLEDGVIIHASCDIHESCVIDGPCLIGANTRLRPMVWVREFVRIGEGADIGHACELKNAWLGDHVSLGHYNYVGDSVLGNGAHFGFGAVTSNFRLDQQKILLDMRGLPLHEEENKLSQDERSRLEFPKFGALIGDQVELALIRHQSWQILGKASVIYPLQMCCGVLMPMQDINYKARKDKKVSCPDSCTKTYKGDSFFTLKIYS